MRTAYEYGGGHGNTGEAQIVCDPDGEPKKFLREFTRGELANKNHAQFAIEEGDYLLRWTGHFEHGGDLLIMPIGSQTIVLHDMCPPFTVAAKTYPHLERALNALAEKCLCYHCRESHYNSGWEPWVRPPDEGEVRFIKPEVFCVIQFEPEFVGRLESEYGTESIWFPTQGEIPPEVISALNMEFDNPNRIEDLEYVPGQAMVYEHNGGYIVTVIQFPAWS